MHLSQLSKRKHALLCAALEAQRDLNRALSSNGAVGHKLTSSELIRAVELRELGVRDAEAAELLGVSTAALRRARIAYREIFEHFGVTSSKRKGPYNWSPDATTRPRTESSDS